MANSQWPTSRLILINHFWPTSRLILINHFFAYLKSRDLKPSRPRPRLAKMSLETTAIIGQKFRFTPVCRLDIRQDSEFGTGYGYPKTGFKREPDTSVESIGDFWNPNPVQDFLSVIRSDPNPVVLSKYLI